ncbi:MAG: AAA family ATPase [Promethearchaeota archaeon]
MSIIKQNFLIILTGLPASGKTTLAKKLKSKFEQLDNRIEVEIVDPDKIRMNLYKGIFDPSKENIVREKNLEKISKGLKSGKIVISDDLNYYNSMRHDLKEIADHLGLRYYIIYISTPLKTCIERNEQRGKPIPNDLIVEINDKFDKFDKYHWDQPFLVYDLSKPEIENIADEIVNLIIEDIKNRQKKKAVISYNKTKKLQKYTEQLEKITRKLTGNFLKQIQEPQKRKEILKLRKKFVKKYLYSIEIEDKIDKEFEDFIKRELNLKQ